MKKKPFMLIALIICFLTVYDSFPAKKIMYMLIPLVTFFFLAGCESYPNDPMNSLENARGDTLRVGAIETAPWIILENGEVRGIEAEIIKGFAKKIDARVEWVKGTEEELMPLLENYELQLLAGGLTAGNPWKKRVGMTGAYKKVKVVVCNTLGETLPEKIEDLEVGVKKGSAIGAYVKKKNGLPVFVDSLEQYNGLVAVYEHELGKFPCKESQLSIYTEKHVIALPRGENSLLMTLEEYLHEAGY